MQNQNSLFTTAAALIVSTHSFAGTNIKDNYILEQAKTIAEYSNANNLLLLEKRERWISTVSSLNGYPEIKVEIILNKDNIENVIRSLNMDFKKDEAVYLRNNIDVYEALPLITSFIDKNFNKKYSKITLNVDEVQGLNILFLEISSDQDWEDWNEFSLKFYSFMYDELKSIRTKLNISYTPNV